MASLNILTQQVLGWLNRQDVLGMIPGWVSMVENDLAEMLRARCMITRAQQAVDNAFITLPSDFATMESIRDATTGRLLNLEDSFSGPPFSEYTWRPTNSYRLVGNCIEFLPHPIIPDPPNPNWTPKQVIMAWYAKPVPLIQPQDTNSILEQHYSVYLFGVCKYGAMYELDDDRATQMDNAFQQAVFAANLWKQQSDYSGAPLRAVVRGF